MYRKLFIVLTVLGLCAPVTHAASQDDFSEALNHAATQQKELLMSPSPTAHKNVIPLKITVDSMFTDVDAKGSRLVKDCPAVRISSHYLLASMACVGLSDTGTLFSYRGAGDVPEESQEKVIRWIENVKIGKQVISKENIAASKDSKLFLIRIDPNNQALRDAIQQKPAANLFIPKNPQMLKSTFSEVKLNREILVCSERTCATVNISNVCTESGCFRLGWKFIDGDTGDPVFGMNPDVSTEEFLLGFNLTDVDVKKRQSGRDYQFFSQETVKFLQDNVQPQSPKDWEQIKRKMVDETYFK